MGQVLHKCAKTTHAVRTELQRSQGTVAALAERFGINPKTVLKWRKRATVEDSMMGPKEPRSTVLSPLDEAAVIAFRKQTLLPLDDVLFALQPSIPHLTRSSLHRLFQRHSISRLPKVDDEKAPKRRFKSYPIGYFHLDICEVHCDQGKQFLFVAIDRTSKFAYAELHPEATRMIAAQVLSNLIEAVPYAIHTVLTDNGLQFTHRPGTSTYSMHSFDRICAAHDIEHRLTQPNHPWTNGQVERMNRTIKEATVRAFHYASAHELKRHLHAFLLAYNCARRLKTLKGKTPYEFIREQWIKSPDRFRLNPDHHSPGLNS